MKNNINEIYKYYYDYWKNANWNTNTISNLSTPDLDTQTIRKGAITYATKQLHISKDKFYETLAISRKRLDGNYFISNTLFITFEKLSDEEDKQEIIKILTNSNQNLKTIISKLNTYVQTYRTKEKETILKDLKNKIKIYEDYKLGLTTITKIPNKEKLQIAHRIILSFSINENISKEEFCKNNNIEITEFETYLNLVKENDSITYSMYINKIEHLKSKEKEKLIKNIPLIIEYLKDENNKFNLLDYYLITKTNLTEFQETIQKLLKDKKISQKEYKILETFISKNKNTKECTTRDTNFLLKEKIITNYQIDQEGRYIENSGTEITQEEKQEILEILKEKSIPISRKIFHLAIQKYTNNTLKSNNKIKTKKWEQNLIFLYN